MARTWLCGDAKLPWKDHNRRFARKGQEHGELLKVRRIVLFAHRELRSNMRRSSTDVLVAFHPQLIELFPITGQVCSKWLATIIAKWVEYSGRDKDSHASTSRAVCYTHTR